MVRHAGDSPNINDNAEIMEMAACGCQMVLYTTGRGSVAGSAIAPVIKVCSNPDTYARMTDDMDINAGAIVTQGLSFQQVSEELLNCIQQTASGIATKSETLGHRTLASSSASATAIVITLSSLKMNPSLKEQLESPFVYPPPLVKFTGCQIISLSNASYI